ncbi:MAG TPA: hypothetical protein H9870_06225 [Candidatus Corynebacterium avicola]|uniref:Secreted protein n=1 Tax=Candidatus Corynebacterium avicola TaxID=2838527 RepID=A0A9D1RP84_9CORY|nr:hypothetical protein [Candidatus Corynebacterium avicola]
MSRLRRSSVALALATSTAFVGAAVTPAVAQDTTSEITSSIEGSAEDLAAGSSDAEGEVSGSLDDACGDTDFGGLATCAFATTAGVTAALGLYGVLRTVIYEVAGV